MNEELISKLDYFSVTSDNISGIKSVLSYEISKECYDSVEGDNIDKKIQTVVNYLNGETAEKQLLNIVIADESSSLEYVRFLEKRFDVVVHNFKELKPDVKIDLVLFTGGEDINPEIYNEKVGKFTHINTNRDNVEEEVYETFYGNVLFLGICRGAQILTALSGGRLIQHVTGHGQDHTISMNGGGRYVMTSSHHQMLYPFDLRKEDYEILAHSEFFRSNTYLNGDNKEIEIPLDFLEPEIVYYKNTNALCIQGHPEWRHCEERTSRMCLNLINKYLKNK